MDKIKTRILLIPLFIVGMFVLAQNSLVQAETQINVTNSSNGTSSSNAGSYTIERQGTVQQTNTVQVNTTIKQNANTGDNNVTDNSGDVEITTGSIQTTTDVNNAAGANLFSPTVCDCDQDVELVNSDNGRDSENTIDAANKTTTTTSQTNTVDVQNKSQKDLNTGNNSAKDNMGNVVITTGDIHEETSFGTKSGLNSVDPGVAGEGTNIKVTNTGNGSGSINSINVSLENESSYSQENKVNIKNKEDKKLHTGGNTCKDNQGTCVIGTGDINSTTTVTNETGSNEIKPTPPKGGPMPTPTPGKDDETPQGGGDVDTPDSNTPGSTTDDGDILEGVRDQIAAVVKEMTTNDGSVLGVMNLPNTGVGGDLPVVAWSDVLVGLLLLLAGLVLRKPVDRWLTVEEKQ